MLTSPKSVFERYPQLLSLKGLVPDDVVEREIGSRSDEYEKTYQNSRTKIPTVRLNKIFPEAMEKGDIRLENFLGHWGNVSIEELCKICLIVKWLKPKRILEIGTYNGMTTLQMALNAPANCIVYTLDLPEEMQASLVLSELDTYVSKHFYAKFGTSTGSYFYGRTDVNIKQLRGDSATFDYSSFIDGSVDLVFIDAAHDYQNKKLDSENGFKLLSSNGVILWHNYADVLNPDVTKCLGEYASSGKLIYHLKGTNLALFYKKV
jgi:hypothetical protein